MIQHNRRMSNDFSDHNWQRLVDAGPQIALAVAASAGSAKQSVAELGAFLRLVDEAADAGGGDDVLGRLASDMRDKLASGMLGGNADDAIPDGIQAAREAGAILAVHSSEDDARIVRQWLLQVAHTVAAAAREGGLLGIGGQELSDRERDTMAEIADGLGANTSQGQELLDEEATEELPTSAETPQGETGPDGQPIGPDNIREGRVRGVMGGPNQQQGEGQGG
jgi:hypothetical protein